MMTATQLPRDAINQDLATIRALSSITSQQADTIAQTVQASGRAWDVQTFEDYDGYLSILIEPSVSDDEQKILFISGTAQHLDLFAGYGHDMILMAIFNDVEELSARLLDSSLKCNIGSTSAGRALMAAGSSTMMRRTRYAGVTRNLLQG